MKCYLMLIKGSFAQWNDFSQEKRDEVVKQFGEFAKMLGSKGYLRGGDGCSEESLRVLKKDSNIEESRIDLKSPDMTTGYFLIEVPSEEVAFAMAKECPAFNCDEYVELVPCGH